MPSLKLIGQFQHLLNQRLELTVTDGRTDRQTINVESFTFNKWKILKK